MADWSEKYEKETGEDANSIRQDEWNAGRTYSYPTDKYVDWLEEKLDELYPRIYGITPEEKK